MRSPDAPSVHDLSYATSANSLAGRALVRALEASTGRGRLIKRAHGYENDVNAGSGFFDVMTERYGLSLEVVGGTLSDIPSEGPVILSANHPYGILDGMMMGKMLSHSRKEFRILANSIFDQSPEMNEYLLPISFEGSKKAVALNLDTRKRALDLLARGGAVGVFPGGTVSTAAKPFSYPLDPIWRSFTARMVAKSQARVVPIYFDGHTSRLFQIASHLHQTLRVGLLVREFRKRLDTPVRVVIGKPIEREILDPMAKDSKAMMDFLRKATYELSPNPVHASELGYEFEERHRANG